MVKFDRSFVPDPSHRAYYDAKYARYKELYEALRPLNRAHP